MRITGLTGLFDVDAVVRALMLRERQPVLRMQQQRTGLDAERAMWSDVQGRLQALKSALAPLTDPLTFRARTASSTDAAVVTATASPGAALGAYQFVVSRLAAAHRVASDPVADPDAALNLSGSPQINGKTVVVTAGMSLRAIADAINAAGAGVRASVVDGRLLLEAEKTGAAHAIRVVDNGGVLLGLGVVDSTGAFKNQLQAAQDALFSFNGLSLTRPDNTISDLVAGVTFTLKGTGANAVTVTVAVDRSSIRSKVEAFVRAYNDVQRTLNQLLAKGSRFQGDGTLMRLQSALRSLATGAVPTGTTYDQLAMVGIRARGGRDVPPEERGLLELDAAQLDAALSADPAAVERLFAAAAATDGFSGVAVRLRDEVARYADSGGLLDARLQSLGGQIGRLDRLIQAAEARLQEKEQQLYAEFARVEQALAVLQSQRAWLTGMVGPTPLPTPRS